MSLMHPTTGEMLDRAAVLIVKIKRLALSQVGGFVVVRDKHENTAHFERELKEIKDALHARATSPLIEIAVGCGLFDPLAPAYSRKPDPIMDRMVGRCWLCEFFAVHDAIWPLIETSPPELLRLNARRVAIREEIDKATGEYRGPEKV
jgi:hypothetical protein